MMTVTELHIYCYLRSALIRRRLCLLCPSALGEGVDNFVRCPLDALCWSQRKCLLLEEILTYRPHILCLQEVDHYYDTFEPVLAGLGYSGHFCPKPYSPCLDVEGNNGPDGCALFYDRSRFELLDSTSTRLYAIMIPTNQVGIMTLSSKNKKEAFSHVASSFHRLL